MFQTQYRQTGTKRLVLLLRRSFFSVLRLEIEAIAGVKNLLFIDNLPHHLADFFYYYDSTFLLSVYLSICFSFLPAFIHSSAVCRRHTATHLQSPFCPLSLSPPLSALNEYVSIFSTSRRRILLPVGWPFVVFFLSLQLIIVIVEMVVLVVATFFVFVLPILVFEGFIVVHFQFLFQSSAIFAKHTQR